MSSAKNTIREKLAEYAHGAWSGWMMYLFSLSKKNEDGSVTIPPELASRWFRQMHTPYEELPEKEKDSDRAEAVKMFTIFKNQGW